MAELHVRALNNGRASGERIIAAGSPFWFRKIAAALKARLGEKASRVSTREAPDWLVRTMGLFNHEARVLAPDLGKRQFYSSTKAEVTLGRPLRSLGEAVTAAGESLIALNLV